jgi:hypothetical protein
MLMYHSVPPRLKKIVQRACCGTTVRSAIFSVK